MSKGNIVQPQQLKYFDLVGMSYVAVLLISTIAAQKLFAFGPFTFTSGIILFPITYILDDVLTEVYGYAKSRRIIWMGFAANLFMAIILAISVALPPAQGWPFQEQYATVLDQVPRIVLASLIAYICGEFSNSFVLAKMKIWTNGKYLWTRTIGSTVVGQAIDTVVFVSIAFLGILPNTVVLSTIISAYIFKVSYEAVATPLTYWIVRKLKTAENIDYYDRNTDFNPFKIG